MYDTVTIAQCGLVSQPRDPGAEPCHVHLVADWVVKVIGYIWRFGPCCILILRWMEDIPEDQIGRGMRSGCSRSM